MKRKGIYLVMGNDIDRDEKYGTYVIEAYEKLADAWEAVDEYNRQAIVNHTHKIYTVRLCQLNIH